MIIQNAFTKGESLIVAILSKMSGIGIVQRKFISNILLLVLSIRGRINFLQLERYGTMSERSYRDHFAKDFDWLDFNTKLIKEQCSDELIIGFDPSYITKSGKCTPGIGYFYSGCSGKYERGLEIGCYSVIDVKQHTAYHLYAKQSKPPGKHQKADKLMDQYISQLVELGPKLSALSPVLVADAFFSKYEYVSAVNEQGMEFISRLRSDANLRYIHNGPQKAGRGRKKQYAGKVNTKKIDKRRAKLIHEDSQMRVYALIVNAINLKMNIRLAYVEYLNSKGEIAATMMYYSTNTQRDSMEIVRYYKARFQMEYNFRDGKQFTGLLNCQARSEEKLNFHFNCTLTAINVGKAIARSGLDRSSPLSISISNIKTELSNYLMLNFIFSKFGIDPNLKKNTECINQILEFGKIAA